MEVRTRFAPSPSGSLHLGSARTALYSWLFARKYYGKFLLRIEDSDAFRSVKENVDKIINELKWLKLDWDEGPYFQTARLDRYNAVIKSMLKNGTAYRCYCSKDRLQILRKEQIAAGKKPKYDGYCRDKYFRSFSDLPFVVRFRNPDCGVVIFDDEIRGSIVFNNNELDDLVICRSNGAPTYNFCVVVDDMDMQITHVIRGEDHISNTPRQVNILKALNASIPKYAHLSIILGFHGKKLSKRCDDFSIMNYREMGFLPEAILNFLVRLGWSCGDQELFTISEMQNIFSLESVNSASSTFNFEKLMWLNGHYINHLPVDYVASHLAWYMQRRDIDYTTGPKLVDIIKFFGKRYKTLKDIVDHCGYCYCDFYEYDHKLAKKYLSGEIKNFFQILRLRLGSLNIWTYNVVYSSLFSAISECHVDIKQIGMSLRVAITGVTQSPELVTVLYICGQVRVLRRLDMALNYIAGNNNDIFV
ncbi:glutamate--tRNA ligase [Blochmannia endosymbiont of Polyrhachis (Hedomyrma) turneri]|uniref:glutamate--tRNA ligase n=1 Tax=Blochmannia endosymbiont of Polyrhachis (Hedomyrma) turneri TaxID=1505596 RepID=UPI00061A55E8|nr:glutamate--tRNA ligase [Blochmannia endosymbiont of Polyrhachis (Hedomyrma) turneri]AKC60066.1 glutamate-tRNA ligase [Blochmannia endosymbiont of Polyrhachis (Hedomyrma) turneri]